MGYFYIIKGFGVPVCSIVTIVLVNVTTAWITSPAKKVYGKEGQNINMIWKYKISPHTHILEFLFGEWSPPGYVSRKCVKADWKGHVVKAENCETKYDYKEKIIKGIYHSNVSINNLSRSDIKTYGIDIELTNYRNPLEDWFELHMFVKAKITEFFISNNGTVKQGDPVNINCRATGAPEPRVTIYKDGLSIAVGKGGAMHKVEHAAIQDIGEYTCNASNDDKEIPPTKRITLIVEGPTQPPRPGNHASFIEFCFLKFLLFFSLVIFLEGM